jgi:hypothetical protein
LNSLLSVSQISRWNGSQFPFANPREVAWRSKRGGVSASMNLWRVPLTPTLSPQAGRGRSGLAASTQTHHALAAPHVPRLRRSSAIWLRRIPRRLQHAHEDPAWANSRLRRRRNRPTNRLLFMTLAELQGSNTFTIMVRAKRDRRGYRITSSYGVDVGAQFELERLSGE